jgi:hypothetical protein
MRHLWMAATVLSLAALVGPARGVDLLDDKADKPTCKAHGTAVDFVDTPSEAARLAKKAGKLVLVLHVSGNFEDPRFT